VPVIPAFWWSNAIETCSICAVVIDQIIFRHPIQLAQLTGVPIISLPPGCAWSAAEAGVVNVPNGASVDAVEVGEICNERSIGPVELDASALCRPGITVPQAAI